MNEVEALFVYGSLKRGQANFGQLARATFVAEVSTAARFALRIIDGYPALVPGTQAVRGELYRIATAFLPELDEFEGDGYRRELIELATGSRALAYLACAPDRGTPHPADAWP